jgi:hypothetical protein
VSLQAAALTEIAGERGDALCGEFKTDGVTGERTVSGAPVSNKTQLLQGLRAVQAQAKKAQPTEAKATEVQGEDSAKSYVHLMVLLVGCYREFNRMNQGTQPRRRSSSSARRSSVERSNPYATLLLFLSAVQARAGLDDQALPDALQRAFDEASQADSVDSSVCEAAGIETSSVQTDVSNFFKQGLPHMRAPATRARVHSGIPDASLW